MRKKKKNDEILNAKKKKINNFSHEAIAKKYDIDIKIGDLAETLPFSTRT